MSENPRSKVEVMASLVMGEAVELVSKAEAATAAATEVEKRVSDAADRITALLASASISAPIDAAIRQASADATKRIHEAAAVAVRGILTAELTGLRETIVEASNQLSANRTETRKWVISVAIVAGLVGGMGALLIAKYLHLIY